MSELIPAHKSGLEDDNVSRTLHLVDSGFRMDFIKTGRRRSTFVEESNFEDPLLQYEIAQLSIFSDQEKNHSWTNAEQAKEAEEKHRLKMLQKSRGSCLSFSFKALYHLVVIVSFLQCFTHSLELTIEMAKFQAFERKGTFNCNVISKFYTVDHIIYILNAVLASCVLYVDKTENVSLCIVFFITELIQVSYASFVFWMQGRFMNELTFKKAATRLSISIFLVLLLIVVLMQRYYDLTNRMKYWGDIFSGNQEESEKLNDDIIYQSQSSFLQRKYISRRAVSSQIHNFIKKIDYHKRQKKEPNYGIILKELTAANLALQDVQNVPIEKILRYLKKANAKRLQEVEGGYQLELLNGVKFLRASYSELI